MKTKKYLVAIAILGVILFTAQAATTYSQVDDTEQATNGKIIKKLRLKARWG